MASVPQIPQEAVGTFAGVLVYSLICLTASSCVLWLTWHHKDKKSYVAFLAFFTTLSTLCSIIQQVHDMVCWKDIITEQFENIKNTPESPSLLVANGSVGMDLILFHIQHYSYCVEALLVLFWALALVQYVYNLTEMPRLRRPLKIMNCAGIFFSIGCPLVVTALLQTPPIKSDYRAYLLVAGQPLIWSLFLGSFALLSIFVQYVRSQRKLRSVSNSSGHSYALQPYGQSKASSAESSISKRGMYDRWLIARFSIAFAILSAFEVTTVLYTMASTQNRSNDVTREEPDLSVARAKQTFILFMPGVSPSLLLFIVFGTTKGNLQALGCGCCYRRQRQGTGLRNLTISEPQPQSYYGPMSQTPDLIKPSLSHQSSLRSNTPRPLRSALSHSDSLRSNTARWNKATKCRFDLEAGLNKPLPPTPEIGEVVRDHHIFRNDNRSPAGGDRGPIYTANRFGPN